MMVTLRNPTYVHRSHGSAIIKTDASSYMILYMDWKRHRGPHNYLLRGSLARPRKQPSLGH